MSRPPKGSAVQAEARCQCGAVRLEIDVPALWAWHDHAEHSRKAQGCAYVIYVGSWRSRFRMLAGDACQTRFENAEARTARSFCARCGTPMFYERARSPKIVNIPRALFLSRVGREPRYHVNLRERADWEYVGEPLMPAKELPGDRMGAAEAEEEERCCRDSMFSPTD